VTVRSDPFARPVDRLLQALRDRGLDYRPGSDPTSWTAQCPAHDDRTPSLSVREADDRRALVNCFAGCETEAVLDALGLDWSDLFPGSEKNGSSPPVKRERPVENLTDLGNARRLVAQHGRDLHYCYPWRSWLAWDGRRWRRDDFGEVERRAKLTVGSIYGEAERGGDEKERGKRAAHAIRSEADARIRAMIDLARSELCVPVLPENLDAEPWLLACANGTIDLRTGELRAHERDDLLTLGTDLAYDADADCPRWRRFLEEVLVDPELIAFVQRAVGYSLTGDGREHALFVCHGSGCNGKTTFVEILKRVAGEFAQTAAFDTFARTRGDRGPRNDLARLHRARLVIASESGEGRRLDEATVKVLTGGDTVAARFLYGEHFEFRPAFKLWLVTNHRPRVDGDDDAIWRRLRLIPFEQSFEGREDRDLAAALEVELPGILRWAIEGCVEWQRNGLGTAAAVERATREYREDEDVLGAFLAERCSLTSEVEAARLRDAYEGFCAELGEPPLSPSALGQRLRKRGIRSERGAKGRRTYVGASLR
jgi:putative DNA primase/helicase